VRAVRAEPERWSEATLGKPVDAYCAFIADPKRWGGQAATPYNHNHSHRHSHSHSHSHLHPAPTPCTLHPAPCQVELAIFAEANQAEISVTDIQSGRADVYGHGAVGVRVSNMHMHMLHAACCILCYTCCGCTY
jgi:hypothetical protein